MKKVLVTDDGSQYDVLQARSGQETLDLISANPDISLLITDQNMPGEWRGSDVIREIRKRGVSLPVILMSSADEKILTKFAREAGAYFISKLDFKLRSSLPIIADELIETGDSQTYHLNHPEN
ncbi:response regulator [Candidatus Woesearchaeota archaeon]|nr:response regulator [Candidatus Woesearchaeota archaeon]